MLYRTSRLTITDQADDELQPAEVLAIINSNPDFIEDSEGAPGKRAYTEAEIVASRIADSARMNHRFLTPKLNENCKVIGLGDLLAPHPKGPYAALGLLIIHRDWQGQGLGREAALAIDSALTTEGWDEVELAVFQVRPRSRRFWESCGYCNTRDTIDEAGHPLWVFRKQLARV
jgi:RimJ/RimL family protein N-acetyltransferase